MLIRTFKFLSLSLFSFYSIDRVRDNWTLILRFFDLFPNFSNVYIMFCSLNEDSPHLNRNIFRLFPFFIGLNIYFDNIPGFSLHFSLLLLSKHHFCFPNPPFCFSLTLNCHTLKLFIFSYINEENYYFISIRKVLRHWRS